MRLPTLFISHGSPMFAVEPGQLGPQLARLAERLPRPRAVLVLSPHWMSRGVEVQAGSAPATIHDFGGFPPLLYTLSYPAPGAPELAGEVIARLAQHGIAARPTTSGGLDHGAWVPLMHLYPGADVPVLEISLPATGDPRALLALGEALAPLRETGVLIVGSGSLTHNLQDFRGGAGADAYATEFAEWVWRTLVADDLEALLEYRAQAPHARRAHPTDEHLLPLYFALGAAGADRTTVARLEGGVCCGAISMDSFVFGRGAEEVTAQ
jgi:4,5-DOPA dioxygenase extradiol